jgi:hypothetical protein
MAKSSQGLLLKLYVPAYQPRLRLDLGLVSKSSTILKRPMPHRAIVNNGLIFDWLFPCIPPQAVSDGWP